MADPPPSEPMVTRCVRHPHGFGCEASLPSCCREIVRLEPITVGYFADSATPAKPVMLLPNALERGITDGRPSYQGVPLRVPSSPNDVDVDLLVVWDRPLVAAVGHLGHPAGGVVGCFEALPDGEAWMTWVKRAEVKPPPHECATPMREVLYAIPGGGGGPSWMVVLPDATLGDLWRCGVCGRLWRLSVGWCRAGWWSRLRVLIEGVAGG